MAIPAYSQTLSADHLDLGVLNGGGTSVAKGLSANDIVVVGYGTDGAAGNANRAYTWSQATGMTSLGVLNGGSESYAYGVSANGNVVVGMANDGAAGNASRAFRWTSATGMISLGVLNGGSASHANAVSANGSVVVGDAIDGAAGNASRAFRWTSATGVTSLGVLNGGGSSYANGVSANGSVVVGFATDGAAGGAYRAYRWTQATGMTSLSTLNGGLYSTATGVSADGSVVVGWTNVATSSAFHAYRWMQATGMVRLGLLNGGTDSVAQAVSADGSVVVGYATDGAAGNAGRAFRWSQDGGMQSVEQWLVAAGVTISPTFIMGNATAANADGSVVVGNLSNGHAYLARVNPQGYGAIDYSAYLGTIIGASPTSLLGSQQADLVLHGLRGALVQSLPAAGQQTAWVSGDLGRRDHLTDDSNIASGEIGYARGLTDRLTLKMALGRTYSTQGLSYGGGASLRGTYTAPELIYRLAESRVYATISGYFNDGEVGVRRGYFNTGSPVQSVGDASVRVAALRMRLDAVEALNFGKATISPYVSVTFIHSRRDGYTEVGGGFPVRWDGLASTTTQARIGADSRYQLNEKISILGRLEGVYRLEEEAPMSTGQVLGLNSFNVGSASYQRAWLRTAAGVEMKVGAGIATFMLNGTSEGNTPRLWAHANYRIVF